ncbi:MAG: diguanylate cyclase [Planctomycetales bacterium]|nr:diguanylate cyclase [Planctomycetales bacterium]
MNRSLFSVATRVTFSLALLSVTTTLVAYRLADRPRRDVLELQRKRSICESLAISCSLHAGRRDTEAIEANLQSVIRRNPDIASARLVKGDGVVVAEIGDHQRHWHLTTTGASTEHCIQVPISDSGKQWGRLEISFTSAQQDRFARWLHHPVTVMGLATVVLNGLLFRWYLGKILTYLNPSTAVPPHVRSTIDTFSEGVAVIDNSGRIVLANRAFAKSVLLTTEDVIGKRLDRFAWQAEADQPLPWNVSVLGTNQSTSLRLSHDQLGERTYLVSASVIKDDHNKRRGVIVSFDDITGMVQKREELRYMLTELQRSRDELTERNRELQVLATRDPLTSCLNRRTFFEVFDREWNHATRAKLPLSCAMVDIDFFKSINDKYGHSKGDKVLRTVAATLNSSVSSQHVVCRYGGEEFCILMQSTDIDGGERVAEKLRKAISDLDFGPLKVTASLGVSAISLGGSSPQELLDQADKCLYVAKRNGRNQVVRWDDVPEDMSAEEKPVDRLEPEESVPYAAVASLISALAYRHADTAAHSTRVAELAVATARGLMSVKDAYILEIGALLHDIGKIGVPDSILLKPGPLTEEEWQVMLVHDRIGVEIIDSAFCNSQLQDILRYHHLHYLRSDSGDQLPQGEAIPLGARIVAIADAYDAIVSDRVYRKGRSQAAAFEELRRCSGTQFDPDLVERFIQTVTDHRTLDLPMTSKLTAMQIGIQIDHLTKAVDDEDRAGIVSLASRLRATAAHCQITAIEDVAAALHAAAAAGDEITDLLDLTSELVVLCQQTQRVYAQAPALQACDSTQLSSVGS